MQWVFIALVVLIVSIFVKVLQQIMNNFIKSLYLPPSAAIIDQMMPQEIVEHIFSFMDPLTLLQSHNVSQYWRFYASKHHIKLSVLERYVKAVQYELPGIKGHWIDYDKDYPIDRRLSDIALAQKRGKILIEMKDTEQPFFRRGIIPDPYKNRYCIKMESYIVSHWFPLYIQLGSKYFTAWNSNKVQDIITLKRQPREIDRSVRYEVIVTLDEYNSNNTQITLIMCRNTQMKEKKWFGDMPMDGSFLQAMLFLAAPIIVHDILISEWFIIMLKQWFGTVAFVVLNGVLTVGNLDMPHRSLGRLYKSLVIWTAVVATAGFILMYPSSSSHCAFLGIFIATFYYGFALWMHCFGGENRAWYWPKSKHKLRLSILCTILVLLINDWSMTVQSITAGTIWHRLFLNTMHFLGFIMYIIWINAMLSVLDTQDQDWHWKYLINWSRSGIKALAVFYAVAILITLYEPYWTGNI